MHWCVSLVGRPIRSGKDYNCSFRTGGTCHIVSLSRERVGVATHARQKHEYEQSLEAGQVRAIQIYCPVSPNERGLHLEKYFWNDNPVVHLISKPFEVPIKAFYLRRLWSTELLFFGKWTAWRFDMFDIVWLLTVASVSIAARPWGLSSFELVDSSLPRVLFLVKMCFWDFRCIIMALQRECSCSCRAIMQSYHDGLGICHFTLADAAW